jgi:drug/metabolite transporter (DMT)-like permease
MIAAIKLPLMLLTPISIGVVAQILLKMGMKQMGTFSLMQKGILFQYIKIFLNPYVFGGLFFYFLSTVFWLYLISRVPLNFAYPMLSLSYIFVALASIYFFRETVSPVNWLGMAIIMVGVALVAHGRG